MQIERSGSSVIRLTLHTYELATLIAAARWAAEGAPGELSPEAVDQLRTLVNNYDDVCEGSPAGAEDGS